MDLSGVTRDVVVPVRADRAGGGGPTPDEVRGPHWRSTSRGFHVPVGTDSTGLDQRVVEAAVVCPARGGVTGWAALGWDGARWFDGTPWGGGPLRPVFLAVGGNRVIRPQPSFAISEERLAPTQVELLDGVRVTIPVRSVCFEMRYARDVREAATTLSMACYNDHVSIEEVRAYAGSLNGWTGIPQCREALALADENLWSPAEVTLLLVWQLDADLGRPRCNAPVFDLGGHHLATPDLIDPETGVVGEYDGPLHLAGARRHQDVVRMDRLREHGLVDVVMTAGDRAAPGAFIARLRAAYARAAEVPASRRRWTLEQPRGWRDTTTVAARRALDGDTRRWLLADRRVDRVDPTSTRVS